MLATGTIVTISAGKNIFKESKEVEANCERDAVERYKKWAEDWG